jgi:hypothetical protein
MGFHSGRGSLHDVVRRPADIVGPATKAPVIRHRLAPAFSRRLLYSGVALLALDLHDQESGVGHLDHEIREILPRHTVLAVGDHQAQPVVFHPGSDLVVLIKNFRRLTLPARVEHRGVQVAIVHVLLVNGLAGVKVNRCRGSDAGRAAGDDGTSHFRRVPGSAAASRHCPSARHRFQFRRRSQERENWRLTTLGRAILSWVIERNYSDLLLRSQLRERGPSRARSGR